MISDLRTAPDGRVIEADLCIIGGGAAAIAMALRLKGAQLKIAIFESAGRAPGAETTALAEGERSGLPYFDLEDSRVRTLGGSTWRWGARSAPMKPIDLQRRSWVPWSGWPIGPGVLEPYHDAVHDLIGLHQPFAYDGEIFSTFGGPSRPNFDPRRFEFTAFQFGKNLIFGDAYAETLAASPNVHVYLNANVTDVALDERGRRVQSADVRTLCGKRITAKAHVFVLACGGIDNARLLLNWDARHGGELCNDSGLVGRMFMEHPTLTAGVVHAKDWQSLCDAFSPGLVDDRYVETGVAPSPASQRDRQILNAVARIKPIVRDDATQALREIIWNAKHRRIPLSLEWYRNEWLKERLAAILKDPFSIPLNIARHLQGKPKRFKADSVVLELRTEQAPNPDSRVTLSAAADPFGLRRAHLHWELTPLDKKTMRVMAETVDSELRRLGLGWLEAHEWLWTDDLVFSDDLVGGYHHMGTTRMSDYPREGVVDRDCKAHALDNFYIAGSSVFPTSGFVNPTFTIFCLAMRLADHLKAQLNEVRAAPAIAVEATPGAVTGAA